jgi:single-stranded DNA-binding protein
MDNITIAGNVGQAPKIDTLPSGKKVAKFSVAVSRYTKGGAKTVWYSCEIWQDGLIEKVVPYITSGKSITILGSLKLKERDEKTLVVGTYTNKKTGEAVADIVVLVDRLTLGSGGDARGAVATTETVDDEEDYSDEIPF